MLTMETCQNLLHARENGSWEKGKQRRQSGDKVAHSAGVEIRVQRMDFIDVIDVHPLWREDVVVIDVAGDRLGALDVLLAHHGG